MHVIGASINAAGVAFPVPLAEGVQNAIDLLSLGSQEKLVAKLAECYVDAQAFEVEISEVDWTCELVNIATESQDNRR